MARASALGDHWVGQTLLVERMRFSRSDSAVAIALGWLAVSVPASGGSAMGWRRSRRSAIARATHAPGSTTGPWVPLICWSGSAAATTMRWAIVGPGGTRCPASDGAPVYGTGTAGPDGQSLVLGWTTLPGYVVAST